VVGLPPSDTMSLNQARLAGAAESRLPLTLNEIHVWRCQVSNAGDAVRYGTTLLSQQERSRVLRFRSEADAIRYTSSRIWLRRLLAGYTGASAASVLLMEAPCGKPFMEDGGCPSPIRFSLSHSGDALVLAFALGQEVGVDVEVRTSCVDVLSLAACFLPHSETKRLGALDIDARRAALFTHWVRREAVLKAAGLGVADMPMVSVNRSAPTAQKLDRWEADCAGTGYTGWDLDTTEPSPGALAVRTSSRDVRIIQRSTTDGYAGWMRPA